VTSHAPPFLALAESSGRGKALRVAPPTDDPEEYVVYRAPIPLCVITDGTVHLDRQAEVEHLRRTELRRPTSS